jgi:hypothetical protein
VVKKSAPVYELSDLHAHHYLKTEWEWRRENDASKRMGVTKGCANLDTVHVQKNHFADVELPEARLVSFIYLELITSKVPEGYKNRCTTQLAQRKKTKQKTNPHHQTPSLMNRTPPSTRSGEAPFQKCFDFSHIRWSVAANTLVRDAPRAPLTLDRN